MECFVEKLLPENTEKLKELFFVFNETFAWQSFIMPSDIHIRKMLSNEQHLVFVAIVNDAVIGGLTAYILPEFETESSLVYIYDLAVKTEYQRQGIGQQLIKSINEYCHRQPGLTEVFVQADEEDDYAIDFYRKTGGKETKVRQFTHVLHS